MYFKGDTYWSCYWCDWERGESRRTPKSWAPCTWVHGRVFENKDHWGRKEAHGGSRSWSSLLDAGSLRSPLNMQVQMWSWQLYIHIWSFWERSGQGMGLWELSWSNVLRARLWMSEERGLWAGPALLPTFGCWSEREPAGAFAMQRLRVWEAKERVMPLKPRGGGMELEPYGVECGLSDREHVSSLFHVLGVCVYVLVCVHVCNPVESL